jgi:hypothetical protein
MTTDGAMLGVGAGAAAGIGAILSFIQPDADSSDGGWTNELGGTPIYTSIDEHLVPVDSDYIQSSNDPASDVCRLSLSNPPTGIISGPFQVSYRYAKSGTDVIDLVVTLKQGTTIIASWTHTAITTTPVTVTQTLTGPQLAAITDFNNLFLEFNANNVVSYTGPGDVAGFSGATFWCGLRAYTFAGIGSNAVRLREDFGNTEQTFATIAGGGLNLTAIDNFRTTNGAHPSANLFVRTLFDQSGNGFDMGQATAANQPKFLLADLGSLPTMQFIAASSLYLFNTAVTHLSQPFSVSMVLNSVSGGNEPFDGNNGVQIYTGFSNKWSMFAGNAYMQASCTFGAWHAASGTFNNTASVAYIDGTTTSDGTAVGTAATGSRVTIGENASVGLGPYAGKLVEMGMWSGDRSSSFAGLNTNQHTYWAF